MGQRALAFVSTLGGFCAIGSVAHSQQAPSSADTTPQLQEVVVTGTLISHRSNEAVSPVQTVTPQMIQRSGSVTLETTLNQMPQFVATAGPANAFPATGGQAELNLLGLGTNRELVLLDGRRIQPSNPDGSVDLNVIPAALVSSIDVLTGGASATYGSEAISGVVNLKLRREFTGLQLTIHHGGSTDFAANNEEVTLLTGSRFADRRGSVMLAVDYSGRQRAPRWDNPFFTPSTVNGHIPFAVTNLASNPPSQAAVDTVFGAYGVAPGSVRTTEPLAVNLDGTLFTPAPPSGPVINYKGPTKVTPQYGPFISKNGVAQNAGATYDLQTPLTRTNVFGEIKYNLTENMQAFTDILYTNYDVNQRGPYNGFANGGAVTKVPVTNPFIPASLGALLASRAKPTAPFALDEIANFLGPITTDSQWNVYQLTSGLKGVIPHLDNWTWTVYGSYGETHEHAVFSPLISGSATETLLNAPDGGASLCQGGLNVFTGQVSLSSSCENYISRVAQTTTDLGQSDIAADLQGDVVSLPAGEVKFAAGAEHRRGSYSQTPDELFQTKDVLGFPPAYPAAGSYRATELYGELYVPLLRNIPLVRTLSLDPGYRFSDYSTVGHANTYKIDLNWEVTQAVRLRGGFSTAFRTPSLSDLFSPPVGSSSTVGIASNGNFLGDPCDIRSGYRQGPNAAQVVALCEAQGIPAAAINTFQSNNNSVFTAAEGNPKLRPETARTYTVGIVLTSPFSGALHQLSGSVDYYNIRVNGLISTLPFPTALAECFNSNGANPTFSPSSPFCAGISRSPANGELSGGVSETLNLGTVRTNGLDFQLNWNLGLEDVGLGKRSGAVELNFAGTYVNRFEVQALPGGVVLDYAGSTYSGISTLSGINNVMPHWKSVTSLQYVLGPVGMGLRWRRIGSLKDLSRVTTPSSTVHGVPAYNYLDANVALTISDKLQLRGGINNLSDKAPPQIGTSPGNTDFNTYDVLGRTYYAAMTLTF